MEPTASTSNLNPWAFLFMVAMCVIMFTQDRRKAVGALLLTAAIVPLGQQLMVFGLHLHFLRLVLLVGLCRVVAKGDMTGFVMNRMDKFFLWWALVGMICGIIRGPSAETFGVTFNALGCYFLIRFLTREPGDVVAHLHLLAVAMVIISLFMFIEFWTHRNFFALFGGVPEVLMERGDRIRAQGPFRIPILAGTFAATLFPMLVGFWYQEPRKRNIAILGIIACVLGTALSNSSGPLLCFVAALLGFGLWPLREKMRLFRRSMVALLIALHLSMKVPVWWIIAKISDLVGGGGWHRSYVIDVAIKHWTEWCLVGTSVTANWAPSGEVLLVDPNNMDITNHYVAQGVGGGILMLGLFVAIIVQAFKILGRGVLADFELPVDKKFLWGLGAALAAHCTGFVSISYFDQIQVFWFWLLAAISSLAIWVESPALAEEPVSASDMENDEEVPFENGTASMTR